PYETWEFLGDKAISLYLGEILAERRGESFEKNLSHQVVLMGKTVVLGRAAFELDMNQCIKLSSDESRTLVRSRQAKILADTFEAVLQAIRLDQGDEVARDFVLRHLIPLLPRMEKLF